MLLANNPMVGMICLEPLDSVSTGRRHSDDSTLESLLASLVASDALTPAACEPVHIVTTSRISRCWTEPATHATTINADLTHLLDELEAEYAQLTGCLAE